MEAASTQPAAAVDAERLAQFWQSFLAAEVLPTDYQDSAERWFMPLLHDLLLARQRAGRPLLLAINGAQGSGKSTLASLLCKALVELHGLRACTVSLDDFYLPRADRQALAESVHPLLATRGVPGTHDVALMTDTLSTLLMAPSHAGGATRVALPRFDKARDDRTDSAHWHTIGAPVDVVIWEGWCLGVAPEPEERLAQPVNGLEAQEDPDGRWRQYVNAQLARYQPLFDQVDVWVMLAAPDFCCVHQWRCEQEAKLADTLGPGEHQGLMSPEQIERFIQFYQRLTQWALASLPAGMHYHYRLDRTRRIDALMRPREVQL